MSDSPEQREDRPETGQWITQDWRGKSYRCPQCLTQKPYEEWFHCVLDGEPYCSACKTTVFSFFARDELQFRHEWMNDPRDYLREIDSIHEKNDHLRAARELVEQIRRNHAGVRFALDWSDYSNTETAGIFLDLMTIATVLSGQNEELIKKMTQHEHLRPIVIEGLPNDNNG